jgi:hypothetical protein
LTGKTKLIYTDNASDNKGPNYNRLWKLKCIVNLLNDAHSKYHAPFKHLAVGKVVLFFTGSIIFKQYISQKHKRFGINIYKLCDLSGYTSILMEGQSMCDIRYNRNTNNCKWSDKKGWKDMDIIYMNITSVHHLTYLMI